MDNLENSQILLRKLFGENRAEWSSASFNELFVVPSYIRKLESLRPCFLIGGRGTGKTTSLKSLEYTSNYDLLTSKGQGYGDQEYLGVLIRMNKNRVKAFVGEERTPEQWEKIFAHYINLLISYELASLCQWVEEKENKSLSEDDLELICVDLVLSKVDSMESLKRKIKLEISKIQVYVNNISHAEEPYFSMKEAPIVSFSKCLSELAGGKLVFCCIDEYENLFSYQQAILNTYIKHAEPPLSYKIGVRKNGIETRQTLDGNDLLKNPDDFDEVEVSEEGFESFAKQVANVRLNYAAENGVNVPRNLDLFLEGLSLEEEAIVLGAQDIADKVLSELERFDSELASFVKEKKVTQIYFLRYWAEYSGQGVYELAQDWKINPGIWKNRFNNHSFASLFWINKGRKGSRIKKYYCGVDTFLSLASGNIRYFLELIDVSITKQFDLLKEGSDGVFVLSPQVQTESAKEVGKRRLDQLEGLADHGVQLKRLVLAIGKVLFEFARSPQGRAPEVTSFVLSGSGADADKLKRLLADGAGHLAFEIDTRTKPTSKLEMKDEEYRLHGIFCAFFEISYRRKRRTTFRVEDLRSVIDGKPSRAISKLLKGEKQSPESELPEQLAFFGSFYEDSTEGEQ